MSDGIFHIKTDNFPHLHFEWHVAKKIVYRGDLRRKPVQFEAFAFNIENHGAAKNAVLIFLRGYRFAQAEPPNAERTNHVGSKSPLVYS